MAQKQLPQDVMVEILLKLPIKSLMRFKCVSKSYRALINSPSFIKRHFEVSKNHPALFIFHYQKGFSATLLFDEISQPFTNLELPRLSEKRVGEITPYGPCNGIFCLHLTYYDSSYQLCLWNPATREVKVLPSPQHISSVGEFFIHGFGIVPETYDYKVVSILAAMDFDIEHSKPFSAEVYNLSTNSWRMINITESAYSLVFPAFCSYLNGVYHWLTLGLEDEVIICFDMGSDKFWKMKLPKVSEDYLVQQLIDCNVSVINDSIVYVKEYSLNYSMDSRIEIWVMNEYGVEASWNKRYTIGPGIGLWKFLGFWKEDEILAGQDNQPLVSYNPDDHQIVHEFPIYVRPAMFQAFRYVGSIFPLFVLNEA